VVSGGAGGTTITITHANAFLSAFCIEVTDTLTGTMGTSAQATVNTLTSTPASPTAGNLVEIARLLMAAGADVNAADTNADSAFLLAAAQGHVEILRLAIEYGADVRSLNRYGGTALIPACHHGHVEAVRVLLRTSIDVNHVNALGWTALLETVILGEGSERYQQITTMLLARGARADIADRDKVAPLAHARQRRQIEIVRLLEAAGAQ